MRRSVSLVLVVALLGANAAHAASPPEAPARIGPLKTAQAASIEAGDWSLERHQDQTAYSLAPDGQAATRTYAAEAPSPRDRNQGVLYVVGGSLLLGVIAALLAGGARGRSGSGCPGGADVCIQ